MLSGKINTVVFDLGGVLIDWNPRHLYRRLFADPREMEDFLARVCTADLHRLALLRAEQHGAGGIRHPVGAFPLYAVV